jgi:hypothetical protein
LTSSPKYKEWIYVTSTNDKLSDVFEAIKRFSASIAQPKNATIGLFVWEILNATVDSRLWKREGENGIRKKIIEKLIQLEGN